MTPGDMLSSDQLNILYEIAEKFNVDPKLILAIGWHETKWGRIGDGQKGMVMGYGSYDSGSDYNYSGFEKQVSSAASKLKAWGMTPGSVSLNRLDAGNSGKLPTGIYATDPAWPVKVWNVYNSITGVESKTAALTPATISSYKPTTAEKLKEKVMDLYYWARGTTEQAANMPTAAEQIAARKYYNKKYGTNFDTKALETEQKFTEDHKGLNIEFESVRQQIIMGVLVLIVIIIGIISLLKIFNVSPPVPIPGVK